MYFIKYQLRHLLSIINYENKKYNEYLNKYNLNPDLNLYRPTNLTIEINYFYNHSKIWKLVKKNIVSSGLSENLSNIVMRNDCPEIYLRGKASDPLSRNELKKVIKNVLKILND